MLTASPVLVRVGRRGASGEVGGLACLAGEVCGDLVGGAAGERLHGDRFGQPGCLTGGCSALACLLSEPVSAALLSPCVLGGRANQ